MEGAEGLGLRRVMRLLGEAGMGESEAREAVTLAEVSVPVRAVAWAVLSRALLAQRRTAEALEAAQRGMADARQVGRLETGEEEVRLMLAEALLANGDREGARAAIAEARAALLTRASRIGDPSLRACFLEARPEAARTLALADELGADQLQ